MALKNVDLDAALRRLADRRIEDAMQEGKFDNLPGRGEPIELEPMPAEENARLMWWGLRLLRQNDFIPDEIIWRKRLDHLKAHLAELRDESRLRGMVAQINHLVHRINTLGTNALKASVSPVCEETERRRLRERIDAGGDRVV